MRNESNFVFSDLLSYHIHKKSLKRGNSYIKSPEWMVNKKATINVKNNNDHCFEYSIVVALHHQGFNKHPERLSNIHHFYSCEYNWEGIVSCWKTGKDLNEIMKQLLLIFCLFHIMKKQ